MEQLLSIIVIFLIYKGLNYGWNKLVNKFKKRG